MKLKGSLLPKDWVVARIVFRILLYAGLFAAAVITLCIASPDFMDRMICTVVYDMYACPQTNIVYNRGNVPNNITVPPAPTSVQVVNNLPSPAVTNESDEFIWENDPTFILNKSPTEPPLELSFELENFLFVGQLHNNIRIKYANSETKSEEPLEFELLDIPLADASERATQLCSANTMDEAFHDTIKSTNTIKINEDLSVVVHTMQHLVCRDCTTDCSTAGKPNCKIEIGSQIWTLLATPDRAVFNFSKCSPPDSESSKMIEKFMKSFSLL